MKHFEIGKARPAKGGFPYPDHGTLADNAWIESVDRMRARAAYARECRRIQRKVFG